MFKINTYFSFTAHPHFKKIKHLNLSKTAIIAFKRMFTVVQLYIIRCMVSNAYCIPLPHKPFSAWPPQLNCCNNNKATNASRQLPRLCCGHSHPSYSKFQRNGLFKSKGHRCFVASAFEGQKRTLDKPVIFF